MTSKAARKRRRQERQRQEMSAAGRTARAVGRYVSPRRLAMLGLAAAVIVGAVFLAQALGGSAEPGRIIDPVRNERTEGLFAGAQVGQLAPNFEGQDLDGNLVRLSDFQGSPVIVNFWATWCTSCRAEIPALQRVFEERQDEGLVVIGVNWGEGRVGAARSYMDDLDATFPVAMDPNGDIGGRYRVRGLPVTVAIDRDGVIREFVGGELSYRAFNQLAQLAAGSLEEPEEEIAPVRDIQTQDSSAG